MSENQIISRYRSPSPAVRGLMFILALAGVAFSGFLTVKGFQSDVALPGCGRGSGCENVLSSAWSKILGMPTALPGLLIYLDALVILVLLSGKRSPWMFRLCWIGLIVDSFLILAAAAYFSYIQYVEIGAFCKYCMATHGVGVVLSLLILFNAPVGRLKMLPDDPPDPLMIAPLTAVFFALLSFALIGGISAIQYATQPETFRVHFMGDAVAFDMYDVPHIGPVDAPNKMVMLFDYACPHCRDVHSMLGDVRNHFGNDMAIVLLPHPLNSKCNPTIEHTEPRFAESCQLARIGLAVWETDPSQFDAFSRWMFESELPRTADEAEQKAISVIDSTLNNETKNSAWIDQTLDLSLTFQRAAMDQHNTDPGLPKIFFNGAFAEGTPQDSGELIQQLERVISQTTSTTP